MIRSKLHSPALAGYEETVSPHYAPARRRQGKQVVAGCGDRSAGDADVDQHGH